MSGELLTVSGTSQQLLHYSADRSVKFNKTWPKKQNLALREVQTVSIVWHSSGLL